MVGKMQYSNYHGELPCYFGFKFLVPLSDYQQIVQRLTEEIVRWMGKKRLMGKYALGKILVPLLECRN